MKLPIYQIDAFARRCFEGNPAAVVPLEEWLPDAAMQAIAGENNLAETAFFVREDGGFRIRWFTPTTEVKLCGHATLAAAYVLLNILNYPQDQVSFTSLSGELTVTKTDRLLTLNFPTQCPEECVIPDALSAGLGVSPIQCLKHEDYLAVFETEEEVLAINPNHQALKQLDGRGVIVTAPSSTYDFVARVFAPKFGIPEDSVTGSAYTQLVPYWSERLGTLKLQAKQVSARGGELFCELQGDRVLISGYGVKYLEGTIEIGI